MPEHEIKNCPRCQGSFECRAGDITRCQCHGIRFTSEEKVFIESRYADCLCRPCLEELKSAQNLFKEKFLFNK